MIFVALILAAVAAVAFGVVVVGVQVSDHRMRLRERSGHGWADGFARKVLGVYVRDHTDQGPDEGQFFDSRGRR